jgi:hypothetical protein
MGLALGLVVMACGEMSENVEAPTRLVSFRVDARALASSGTKGPRAALVWRTRDAVAFAPTGDTPMDDLGRDLSFDVRRPPPDRAFAGPVLVPTEGTPLRFSRGFVVVYTDGNGNGALDLRPGTIEGAEGDRIVGASATLAVVWLERTPSDAESRVLADRSGHTPVAGLNLVRLTRDGDAWLGASDAFVVGEASTIPSRLCTAHVESPEPELAPVAFDLQRIFPPKGSPGLSCSDGGRSVVFRTCVAAGLCASATDVCTTLERRLTSTEPVPAAWPCDT